MAKKDKDTIFNEFLADLKAVNPAVEEILKDEKVSAKLRESVLARADYSQSMDTLKAEREQFAGEVAEARQKIAGWQKWYGDTAQEISATKTELEKYRETYGDLDSKSQTQVANKAGYLTKEDFQKALGEEIRQRDLASLKFADDLTDIKMDYRDRFHEPLPTPDVYQIAGDRGVDLKTAYGLFISDRVEEQRKAKYDADIAKAKEEGAAEYASKHNLPVVPSISDIVHYADLDSSKVPQTARDRIAAAVAGHNSLLSQRK